MSCCIYVFLVYYRALVLRRRYAAKSLLEEEEEEYQDNDNQNVETASVIKDLTRRLDDLQACNDLMMKQGSALQRALADLEMLESPSPELTAKVKIVSERATLFRIAANAMINVSPNNNPCQMILFHLAHLFSKSCNNRHYVLFD